MIHQALLTLSTQSFSTGWYLPAFGFYILLSSIVSLQEIVKMICFWAVHILNPCCSTLPWIGLRRTGYIYIYISLYFFWKGHLEMNPGHLAWTFGHSSTSNEATEVDLICWVCMCLLAKRNIWSRPLFKPIHTCNDRMQPQPPPTPGLQRRSVARVYAASRHCEEASNSPQLQSEDAKTRGDNRM